MDNLLTVAFEAHHAEKNHHRRYELTIGRDLLNDWTVAIRYGRTGQGGHELRYASARPEEIRSIIRERPAPPPVGAEADRMLLPAGGLQRRAGFRCRFVAAKRGHGWILWRHVIARWRQKRAKNTPSPDVISS